ncbi:hypothetical protein [Herbidospora sp. RD11066]
MARRTKTRPDRGDEPRRIWDADKRRAAAHLDQMEPAWVVSWGTGSRRFFAVAAWPVSRPLIIEALGLDELRRLMRMAEMVEGAMDPRRA